MRAPTSKLLKKFLIFYKIKVFFAFSAYIIIETVDKKLEGREIF